MCSDFPGLHKASGCKQSYDHGEEDQLECCFFGIEKYINNLFWDNINSPPWCGWSESSCPRRCPLPLHHLFPVRAPGELWRRGRGANFVSEEKCEVVIETGISYKRLRIERTLKSCPHSSQLSGLLCSRMRWTFRRQNPTKLEKKELVLSTCFS